jgi:hypothetical protein
MKARVELIIEPVDHDPIRVSTPVFDCPDNALFQEVFMRKSEEVLECVGTGALLYLTHVATKAIQPCAASAEEQKPGAPRSCQDFDSSPRDP